MFGPDADMVSLGSVFFLHVVNWTKSTCNKSCMNEANRLGHASRLKINSLARWLDQVIVTFQAEGRGREKVEAVEAPPTLLLDDKNSFE